MFDDSSITKISYAPMVFNTLLEISINNKKIKSIQQVREQFASNYYIHLFYKFGMSEQNNGYVTYGQSSPILFSSALKSHTYNVSEFNIEIYKNNASIYKEDINYFENLYFNNPYNRTIDMNKFIKIAVNDALNHIRNED